MWNFGRTSDDEALRLVTAFLKIAEPERRQELVRLAERYERVSVRPVNSRPAFRQDNEPATQIPDDVLAPQ